MMDLKDRLLFRHLGRLDFPDASDTASERGWLVSVETCRGHRVLDSLVEGLAIVMSIPDLFDLQARHPSVADKLSPGPFVLIEKERSAKTTYRWVEVGNVREIGDDWRIVSIESLHEAAALALGIADGDREVEMPEAPS